MSSGNIKEIYDFSKIQVSPDKQYLRPGQYTLSIIDCKYEKPTGTKPDGSSKSPYLNITFSGQSGQLEQKFYITPKTFERIQTLHMYWFDKVCDKSFDSTDAVGVYFAQILSHAKTKQIKKNVIIGGKQGTDGKVYAELPYSKYIAPENVEFVEQEYAPGTPKYIQVVKVSVPTPASYTDDVMIPSTSMKENADISDDLPF